MRHVIRIALAAAALALTGCQLETMPNLDPDEQAAIDELQEQAGQVQAQKEDAVATLGRAIDAGDMETVVEVRDQIRVLDLQLTGIEKEFRELEEAAIAKRVGSWANLVGSLPFGNLLLPFAPLVTMLAPSLLSKRGWKHYIRGAKQLNPWSHDEGGGIQRGIAAGAFVKDVLRALGSLHSSPDTEAVFEGRLGTASINATVPHS